LCVVSVVCLSGGRRISVTAASFKLGVYPLLTAMLQ
jgi:hypothetical protein